MEPFNKNKIILDKDTVQNTLTSNLRNTLTKQKKPVKFTWQGLANFGIGVWPEKVSSLSQVSEEVFLQAASRIGYDASLGLTRVLGAVRLHFAPSMNGPLTAADCALITNLEKAFVIDPSIKKV